ncbi:MAG: hypothetical protein ACKOTB_07405 [Planctomycetia bacterium]
MMLRRTCATIVCVLAMSLAKADTIIINVDPAGTTSNRTVYGTQVTGGVATWPGSGEYRDYQFELLTTAGSTTFDGFAVQLSAQLRQNTPSDNLLRATLWSGPMIVNPLLSNSLVTVSVPNSSLTSSGYSSVLLTGPSFSPLTISTTPSTFFFRVWAEGSGQNNGYQTKLATTLGEYQLITMAPAPAIDGYVEFDTNDNGVVDSSEESSTRDPVSETLSPVPEIDPASAACAVVLAVGSLGLLERRRLRAC